MQHRKTRRGFTLIEVLVVVLIIGILAAIALPMYNRAVLRSRFNALMPIVKAMNDSNEAYYLEHGSYASNPQDLPVQGQSSYPTGTELEFGNNMDYAYVLASNSSARNNYIMYQKHSANYPGEIHCEAITGDDLAEYVCESAGGTQNLGTTLTEGYTTYVLSGTGAGIAPGADDNADPMSCDKAIAQGLTCNITTNEQGQTVKQMCKNGVCRTKTYNEDGSYTSVTCQVDGNGVCTSNWKSSTYDANGNKLSERGCNTITNKGDCSEYKTYGNYDYTYDGNGNQLSQLQCNTVASNGSCSEYSLGPGNRFYGYDENGNRIFQGNCSSTASDGSCQSYSGGVYEYDANGNLVAERGCGNLSSDGVCYTSYSSGYVYTYDTNGNMLTQRQCRSFSSNGACSEYWPDNSADYTYNANGNTSVRYCSNLASDGNCNTYGRSYYFTYDENGKQVSSKQCDTVAADGTCATYTGSSHDYVYDDNGKQIADLYCIGSNLNTATGECIAYNGATTFGN